MIDKDSYNYAATSYNFCFVLYPDSNSYSCEWVLSNVKSLYYNYSISNYAYILHDSDVVVESDVIEGRYSQDELGNSRKPHYHLLVSFKSQKSYRSVLKLLGLYGMYTNTDGQLQLIYPFNASTAIVHKFRNYIKYMLHRTPDSSDKHQYDIDDLVSSDPELISKISSDSIIIDDSALFKDIVLNHQ